MTPEKNFNESADMERNVSDMVNGVMKRANQLAPNSNFRIDGFEAVKFRNVARAIIEAMLAHQSASTPTTPEKP